MVAYTLFLQQKYREALQPLRKVLEGYAKDRKIIEKGVFSEGDILPAPGRSLTPLEKAGLKSMLLLYRIAQHLGGYPTEIRAEFRVPTPPSANHSFALAKSELGVKPAAGRAAWADFDKDGRKHWLPCPVWSSHGRSASFMLAVLLRTTTGTS